MLSRRIVAARPLPSTVLRSTVVPQFTQRRTALTAHERAELADPNQNGGYINPPLEKRNNRDPYADWWDKQERRNYGEPLHEDEDILGRLSPEEYTHASPGKAVFQLFFFVGAVFGLAGIVSMLYPDKPALPRTFPDGLESELGGPGAVRVSF